MERILALQAISTQDLLGDVEPSTKSIDCSTATSGCSTVSSGCKAEEELGW